MKRSHYYCYKCTHAANQIQIIAALLSSLTLHARCLFLTDAILQSHSLSQRTVTEKYI